MANAENSTGTYVHVWDIAVRLFHWSLVTTVIAAYFIEHPRDLHRTLGYIVLGLVCFRIIWGFIGTRHARFTDFVPNPRALLQYLKDMRKGTEARYLGHNPAGGAMIISLIVTLLAVCGSGYMMGMDAYFGQEWVEEMHEFFVNILLVLVIFHVAGVVVSSRRHNENLVAAMVTGHKMDHEPTSDR